MSTSSTGDGHPIPLHLASEIVREIARLALVQKQIVNLERERDERPMPCTTTEKKSSVDVLEWHWSGYLRRHDVESASKSRVWETTTDAHERGKNFLNDIEAEKLLEAAKRG